jgi:predicted LPLAT superfamily acyltransferase
VASWKGKTRGNLAGYKIFIAVLKISGLPLAYFLLRFVALYFFFFSFRSFSFIFSFYRKRIRYGFFRSVYAVYRNYYRFGQILLDKIAAMSGIGTPFTFAFEGEEHLRKMVEDNTGGLLISAHIGNFEMAGHLLERLETTVHVIMFDAEHEKIKDLLSGIMKKSFHVIVIKDDNSHIYQIKEAFNNKNIVCIHGDRYVKGSRALASGFLGDEALFPAGPFYLGMKFNVPVSFVFAMKENQNHYHFYATPPKIYQQQGMIQKRDHTISIMIEDYITELEKMIRKYPEQWFNYYNFWENNDQ